MAIQNSVSSNLHSILDNGGCYVILICDINAHTFTIVGVHGPNSRQGKLLSQTFQKNYWSQEKQFNSMWSPQFGGCPTQRTLVFFAFPTL